MVAEQDDFLGARSRITLVSYTMFLRITDKVVPFVEDTTSEDTDISHFCRRNS